MCLLFIESRKMGCNENQCHRWLRMFCVRKIGRCKETKDAQNIGFLRNNGCLFCIIVPRRKKRKEHYSPSLRTWQQKRMVSKKEFFWRLRLCNLWPFQIIVLTNWTHCILGCPLSRHFGTWNDLLGAPLGQRIDWSL